MFCLDFAFAFAAHMAMVRWTCTEEIFSTDRLTLDGTNAPPSHSSVGEKTATNRSRIPVVFGIGAVAGATSALLLYPFDLVRQFALKGEPRSHFAYSTIPFMCVYTGTYFWWRKPQAKFSEKLAWAAVATTTATIAELPFDHTKIAVNAGSVRLAVITSGLRIPLASLLLVAYDQILLRRSTEM